MEKTLCRGHGRVALCGHHKVPRSSFQHDLDMLKSVKSPGKNTDSFIIILYYPDDSFDFRHFVEKMSENWLRNLMDLMGDGDLLLTPP